MQNGYVVQVLGPELAIEALVQWVETLLQARSITAIRRQDYNDVGPHSSMRRIPAARFADRGQFAANRSKMQR